MATAAVSVSESKARPLESEGIIGRRSFLQLLLEQLNVAEVKKSGETLEDVVEDGHGRVSFILCPLWCCIYHVSFE